MGELVKQNAVQLSGGIVFRRQIDHRMEQAQHHGRGGQGTAVQAGALARPAQRLEFGRFLGPGRKPPPAQFAQGGGFAI